MAYRLMLPHKPGGLPWMWNVSAHVGDRDNAPNRPTDVELVKAVAAAVDFNRPGKSDRHPNCNTPSLVINGRFDQTLAYLIYRGQSYFRGGNDGVVSPIGRTGDPATWLLAHWNLMIFRDNRTLWENLPGLPMLSPGLKAELARTL